MSLRQYTGQQNEQQMFGVACVGDDFWCSSACLELDQTSQIISYEEYHPFGTTSYHSGRTETEVSLKRYKYVGKERDEETGLYYYGARYYAAWICRFVSVDPLQFEYPYYTPYQYAGNKPISYIDLVGLEEAKKDNAKDRFVIISPPITASDQINSQTPQISIPKNLNIQKYPRNAEMGNVSNNDSDKANFEKYPLPPVAEFKGNENYRNSTMSYTESPIAGRRIAEVSSFTELIEASLGNVEIAIFKGKILNDLKNDPVVITLVSDINKQIKLNNNYMKTSFDLYQTKAITVQFGSDNKFIASTQRQTWTMRHAQLKWHATVSSGGDVSIEFRVFDTLDLSSDNNRQISYNIISDILGGFYHNILKGNENMQTRAQWIWNSNN